MYCSDDCMCNACLCGDDDDLGFDTRWMVDFEQRYGCDTLDAAMCNRSFSLVREEHPMVLALGHLDSLQHEIKSRQFFGDDLPF